MGKNFERQFAEKTAKCLTMQIFVVEVSQIKFPFSAVPFDAARARRRVLPEEGRYTIFFEFSKLKIVRLKYPL